MIAAMVMHGAWPASLPSLIRQLLREQCASAHLAKRELAGGRMPTIRALVIELAVIVVIGILLAALGPFGSFSGSFASRLLYWIPAALVGYAIFRPISFLAARIADALHISQTVALYIGGLVAAVPGTLGIAILGGLRFQHKPSFEALFGLYVNVALVGLVVATIFFLMEPTHNAGESHGPRPTAAPVPVAVVSPLFFDRLPPAWNGELRALEMEDHYVRAHGPDGRSELILMRMRDAEAELDGIEGMRVHRSWWVAKNAIEGRRRDGRNWLLKLTGGLEAPVARDRVAELRGKGLL
ncbi:MAG: LytTR family transcriptional regulator DNA-binding domain-containing protein [Sphingomicrobium sp.]